MNITNILYTFLRFPYFIDFELLNKMQINDYTYKINEETTNCSNKMKT